MRRLLGSRSAGRAGSASLLLVGFVLLLGAWIGASAPGNGPDEPANYIKAVGAGTGQPLGRSGRLSTPDFGIDPAAATRRQWIDVNTRGFRLPAGLTPERFTCDFEPFAIFESTTCTARTAQPRRAAEWTSYVGTYPPFVFAVPGVVMGHMSNALPAMYVGRAVLGLLTAVLLAIAIRCAWSPRAGSLSLVGTALAVSPMLLFLGTTLGTNGIEVAGALCLFAAVLRSARPDPARWLWAAAFAGAATTTLARPTGLLWLALAAALALVLHGLRPAIAGVRRGRGLGWLVLTVLAALPAVLWERLVQPRPSIKWSLVRASLRDLPTDFRHIGTEWIGVFGWASVKMTPWAYRLWLLLIVLLVVASVLIGRTLRERLLAPTAVVVAILLVAILDLFIFRQTRFPVYGRYTLPLGMLVPLVAGHVVALRAAELQPRLRRLVPLVALPLVALVQLIGLWTSARRAAVGIDGPAWFFGQSQFAPPGGWQPWFALAVLGVIAVASAGLPELLRRAERDEPGADPAGPLSVEQPASSAA